MRISRRQSFLLAAGVIILFFVVGNFLLGISEPSIPPPPEAPASSGTLTPPGGSELTLREFHRSETRNGRTLWEVRAARGKYFPEEKKALLEEAKLWFYKEDGETIILESSSAELFFSASSLSKAFLSKGVSLALKDTIVETDRAEFDYETKQVVAPGPVRIKSPTLDITGKEMRANVDTREFTLYKKVSTKITDQQDSDDGKEAS